MHTSFLLKLVIHMAYNKMTVICFFYNFYFFIFLFYLFIFDPEDFLLFNNVGYSLQQGYEAQSHVKAFEQISSALFFYKLI